MVDDLGNPMSKVFSTLSLPVDPARLEEFLELMRREAPRTRAFDGCLRFEIYVGDDGAVLFVEHWASQAHSDRYGEWRRSTGDMDLLGSYLVAAPQSAVYRETGV